MPSKSFLKHNRQCDRCDKWIPKDLDLVPVGSYAAFLTGLTGYPCVQCYGTRLREVTRERKELERKEREQRELQERWDEFKVTIPNEVNQDHPQMAEKLSAATYDTLFPPLSS